MLSNIADIIIVIALLIMILVEIELLKAVRNLDRPFSKKDSTKKHKKEQKTEQKKFETLMSNIEAYDGTSIGQRKIDE